MQNDELFNPEPIKQIKAINIDILHRIVEKFIVSIRKDIELANNANDSTVLKNIAHKIKGSAGNLGAIKLQNIAGKIENLIIEGNIKEAEKAFKTLVKISEQTILEIQNFL